MWRYFLIFLVIAGLVTGGVLAYGPVMEWWKWRNRVQFRTVEVVQGPIISVVNATGTIKPVLQVAVGAFVSGPVLELHADFNDEVEKGDLIAKIDPRLYQANVDRDEAALANRVADVERAKAQLQKAQRDEQRGILLRAENPEFIAQAEMDKLYFNRKALAAQLLVAESAVKQAQAQLDTSNANLKYCEILSPVDGTVINRKIDEGQTVAASFQTPELFVIAPDMRKEMHVHASVDEADIGQIRNAQKEGRIAHFTVDAYPTSFEGKIKEIRFNSTTTQNVVTYPVIIAAENPKLQLLPGMTASISFVVEERKEVVKIPNSALRYFPLAAHVREADKRLIEGLKDQSEEDRDTVTQLRLSADERAARRRSHNRRHVWLEEGEGQLRAVEVELGISDSRFTELVEGDIKPGDRLVTGIKAPEWGPPK